MPPPPAGRGLNITYYWHITPERRRPVTVCLSVSVGLYVCLSICLSVCLSVCLPACLSACLPACLAVCLPAYMSVCLSVRPSVCLSVCLSVCKSHIAQVTHSRSHPALGVTDKRQTPATDQQTPGEQIRVPANKLRIHFLCKIYFLRQKVRSPGHVKVRCALRDRPQT